jgi:two-component system, NtrC family, sensor kinase
MLLTSPPSNIYTAWSWIPDLAAPKLLTRKTRFAVAMLLTVAVVGCLVYWDADRESSAALQDFAQEQATLAQALGASLRASSQAGADDVRADLRTIESRRSGRRTSLVLLVHRQGETFLRTTDGRQVTSPRLIDALDRGDTVARLTRSEAALLGLPSRTAVAGLDRGDASSGSSWDVVAIATAERERDRELWTWRRSILSVLTAASLVVVFGGLAMRNQRKELLLERELAMAGLRQSRDERLLRANKVAVMGTLAMGVAHEISTPLGVITARVEQMAPKVAHDDRLTAGMTTILTQIDRIKHVIRGLLGLARGDSPSAERIEPRALIENAVGLVEHRFHEAGVRLAKGVAPGLPLVVGDPRLLEHAVVNLLLNACDACGPESEVMVTAQKDDTGVKVVVDDNGSGISPADIGRALEPFFTTKARDGGTGLGLAIAHEIVASHRGTLVLATRAPHGTRATIHLPAANSTNDG